MFRAGAVGLGVAAWLICGLAPAPAASISYEFSGTLAQPYNGSNQFSGTFTYATDLPLNPAVQPMTGWSYYTGGPNDPSEPVVSLSFKLGNTSSSSLGTIDSTQVIVLHNASNDGFYLDEHFAGQSGGYGLLANIGMVNDNTLARGPFSSTSLPSSLSLSSFSMGPQLDLTGIDPSTGQWVTVLGRITSLIPLVNGQPVTPTPPPVPVPEPASLLIFAVLGAGACGLGRVRRAR